ncbi:MAG: PDZ domain-containing protein, partial [Actinomycetota bacterium]|nr:PDZ domain-containing protein [Actinomycetota bacterium]
MADPVRRVLALVPLLGALAVLGVVPLPMYVVGPGPARDVIPLIRIEGREIYPPRGQLLLTTVALEHSTTLEAVAGWLDAYQDVVPERLILPPGVTPREDNAIQRSAMDESKLTAAAVALRRVTAYPQERGVGALVSRVEPGTLADGVLFSGDLIVSIDGRPVRAPGDVEAALLRIDAEREVMLRIRVDDGFRSVRLSRARAVDALGRVELIEAFPFPLVIESGDIGGPSAGLLWAVGLVDLLTP